MAARSTQVPINVVPDVAPEPSRVTQVPINIVELNNQPARITQVPINIVYLPPQPGRVTQVPINTTFILDPTPPKALRATYPVEEMWEWKTTIVKGYSGREQRMSLREEPFMSVHYNLALMNDADRQTMLYTFHRFIGDQFHFPLFVYTSTVETTAGIGDTVIEVDTTGSDFRDGEAIAVFNDDLSFYRVLQTTQVVTMAIQLAAPLEEEIAAGLRVAPAPLMYIKDQQSFSMGVFFGQAKVEFNAVPPRNIRRPFAAGTVETFDGLPLLPDLYLIRNKDDVQIDHNIMRMKSLTQAPVDRPTWLGPQWGLPRSYRVLKEDLDDWRQFAADIVGGRNPFILPSFRSDFTLSQIPSLGATTLVTEDNYVADYFKFASNKYLRIVTANGVIYRKVQDAILQMDRTVRITLTQALGGNPGDNVISMISLAHKARLSDDTITLVHHLNHIELSFTAMSVDQ